MLGDEKKRREMVKEREGRDMRSGEGRGDGIKKEGREEEYERWGREGEGRGSNGRQDKEGPSKATIRARAYAWSRAWPRRPSPTYLMALYCSLSALPPPCTALLHYPAQLPPVTTTTTTPSEPY